MAPRSKNSKTSATKKRSSSVKSTPKKQTKPKSKKRTVSKKKKQGSSKKGLLLSLVIFVMVSLVAFGYYLGQNESSSPSKAERKMVSHQKTADKKTSNVFSRVKTKHPKKEAVASPVVKHTQKQEPKKAKDETALAYRTKKPKLVIIIDDVSNAKQLQWILTLGIPVTPSIFPPSALSMKSHTLARGLKHYMIHLPMESGSAQFNKQYKTLKTSFSKAQMESRMKEIRRLFPTARYINNHTGSVFTNDYKAMNTLYGIMKKEGFVFIDSRTIGSTKVKKIAHAHGDAYVARDIFIDNRHSIPYIHQQLRKAVNIARKKGYAIAIGHPHRITMKALASAKDIFKDVELVYIDQIYQKR
ncbi:divergent polysaccharide deacetylase family protein [Sulfurovum riftiae]|uniref:Divergent polysaccharide deacetylase n=1 Tax=Sulfurovum riftiae TaxID=1630136 RepID=A0A151CDF5_9BACT|nr:divergent polysaccharide deacetylase family protein [Sulfurovum riftiae]KYJ85551.1 hypothetical protein AS592_04360 [Sulfurovum riftiae]